MREKINVNCVHICCVHACMHADYEEAIEACCSILRKKARNLHCGLFPAFWPTPEHCIKFGMPDCQKGSSQKEGHTTENWLSIHPEGGSNKAAQVSEGFKSQEEMKMYN